MTEEQDNHVQQEINRAINFLGQNKFLEAENTCLKIIDSGDNADAYHILSSIKIYQQEFEASIKYVKKSIAINDANPGSLSALLPVFLVIPNAVKILFFVLGGFPISYISIIVILFLPAASIILVKKLN